MAHAFVYFKTAQVSIKTRYRLIKAKKHERRKPSTSFLLNADRIRCVPFSSRNKILLIFDAYLLFQVLQLPFFF